MSLFVRFSGRFAIESVGKIVKLPLRGVTLEMFCYLSLYSGRDIWREKLAALFWPDRSEGSARSLLSTALWRIRKAIIPLEGASLEAAAGAVCLHLGNGAVADTAMLESAFKSADYARLAESLGTEDLEFLEGIASNWAQIERERQFNLRIRALTVLLDRTAQDHRLEEALGFARRILALDPFRECVHRQIMWLYVEAGQQARALRQYAHYEALLLAEMGLKPARETVALRDVIRTEGGSPAAGGAVSAEHLRQIFNDASTGRHSVYAALSTAAE